MRKHPLFAYEMLSPIAYLDQALDIPYRDHEKWDGTGYPRRLKGEQIPLAAHIFAVIDVWDVLTSDRLHQSHTTICTVACSWAGALIGICPAEEFSDFVLPY
jgi:HD-GYP domain-containing protein (c-di-GMP phosphodiesterase class II)